MLPTTTRLYAEKYADDTAVTQTPLALPQLVEAHDDHRDVVVEVASGKVVKAREAAVENPLEAPRGLGGNHVAEPVLAKERARGRARLGGAVGVE